MQLHFIIAGFSKCGTTTLHSLLSEHPDIFLSQRKDFGFFDKPDPEQHWEKYESWFGQAATESVAGEASAIYSGSLTEVISRQNILKYFPDIKLIFIARDPIDRIESSFREFHHSGSKYGVRCPYNLADALTKLPAILEDTRYWQRINNYRQYMSDEQILVLFLEDLKTRPEQTLGRCFHFLGVDPEVKIATPRRRLNAGSTKLYDSDQLRKMRKIIPSPKTGRALRKIPLKMQDELFVQLGLRKRFDKGPLEWEASTQARVLSEIGEDIHRFLAFYHKPLAFWPRFAQAYAEMSNEPESYP